MQKIGAIVIVVGLALFALVGSGCCKHLAPTVQTVLSDSTMVETSTTVRDTTIKTPASSVEYVIRFVNKEKDTAKSWMFHNLDSVVKTKSNATLKLTQQGSFLKAECLCDTLAIQAKLKHTNTSTKQTKTNTTTKTETKEVKYIPWWVELLALIGAGFLIFLILFFTIKAILK